MDSVTQYIQGELLSRRAICLPYIGTLAVVRHSAELSNGGGCMIPPYDVLELDTSSFDESRSLPALLGSVESYNEWYYSCVDSSGRVLFIEDICSIDLNTLNIAVGDSFLALLAPTSRVEEPVAIGRSRVEIASSSEVATAVHRTARRKSGSNWALTLSLLLVIGALIYILYTSFFTI